MDVKVLGLALVEALVFGVLFYIIGGIANSFFSAINANALGALGFLAGLIKAFLEHSQQNQQGQSNQKS